MLPELMNENFNANDAIEIYKNCLTFHCYLPLFNYDSPQSRLHSPPLKLQIILESLVENSRRLSADKTTRADNVRQKCLPAG